MAAAKQGVRLRQTQRLALTPEVRQSLALLRLPTDALREEIAREAAENPFLVVRERRARAEAPAGWDMPAPEAGLAVSLVRQVRAQRLAPPVEQAAFLIAAELRSDGYLDAGLDELAAETGASLPDLAEALAAIQRCEPSGVGARTLAECIALQLADRGFDRALAEAAVARLPDFAERNLGSLTRALGCGRAEIDRLAAAIRACRAVPVEPPAGIAATRVPDLVARRAADGTLTIVPNPDAVPQLSVMRLEGEMPRAGEYGAAQVRARQFARALAARIATLRRIGEYLAAAQPRFFDPDGPTLAPDSRVEAARTLGLHPSTLGRAIAEKALSFDGRVVPLCAFFSAALASAEGLVSAHDVQRRIRELIASENPRQALADADLTAQLKEEGVDIARRTVAKYRKWMRIPSSFERNRQRAMSALRASAKAAANSVEN